MPNRLCLWVRASFSHRQAIWHSVVKTGAMIVRECSVPQPAAGPLFPWGGDHLGWSLEPGGGGVQCLRDVMSVFKSRSGVNPAPAFAPLFLVWRLSWRMAYRADGTDWWPGPKTDATCPTLAE